MKKSILIVDDEPGMRDLLEIVLSAEGYVVTSSEGINEACNFLEQESYDAVVTDLRIGNDSDAGMELLSWMQSNATDTPSIMMTAHGSVENAIEAMKRGATDYILKPFKNEEIKIIIQRAIEQNDIVQENKTLRKEQAKLGQTGNMIGNSGAIMQVQEMVRRVAVLPSTIAIHGESGSGKELVARSVHQLSDRSDRPFVAINCGGIPENLLESELFGHKKGAFTSAFEDKRGLFEAANGGTLFLDEIGEMPLALQVKLLRVLDNQVVTPLGGTESIHVDVRLISATNRNLEEMSKEGTFREDLFYRLNVIPLNVPPLRDRKEDIPLLVRHFIKIHSEKMGRQTIDIVADVMEALSQYNWPGNVRELGNVIERAVALCTGEELTLLDLPNNVLDTKILADTQSSAALPADGLDIEALIADIEKDLIQQALTKSRHSQKKAAELLGLTPRSLRYRLQKYEMGNEDDF
jgi:two-component system response regulator PilR (NtrC family)